MPQLRYYNMGTIYHPQQIQPDYLPNEELKIKFLPLRSQYSRRSSKKLGYHHMD